MLKKILGFGILVVLIAAVVYGGMAVYANFIQKPGNGADLKLPDKDKAQYSVMVKNTGGLMLTNNYEQFGQTVGSRVFVLHGFWERTGQDFIYRKADLPLDEKIWGIIVITRRQ